MLLFLRIFALLSLLVLFAPSSFAQRTSAPEDTAHTTPKHRVHARIQAPKIRRNDASNAPAFVFEYDYQQPAPPPQGVRVDVNERGLQVASADDRFQFGLSAFGQFTYRLQRSNTEGGHPDGFVLHKLRPSLRGRIGGRVDYKFTLDIKANAVNIHDAFLAIRPHERLILRVGIQKPIFGIEQRQSTRNNLFLSRSLAASIGASRDIGLAIDAPVHDRFRIELGMYNGVADGQGFRAITPGSPAMNAGLRWSAVGRDHATDDAPGYLTIGASTHLRRVDGRGDLPQLSEDISRGGRVLRTYADDVYADGRTWNNTAFAYGGYRGFYALAEFVTAHRHLHAEGASARVVEHAWHGALAYTFGGMSGWNGTIPHRSVFDGGLGALRIAARAHGKTIRARGGDYLIDVNGQPTHRIAPLALGASLAWQLSETMRLQTDYDVTTFDIDRAFGANPTEHVVQFGVTIGY